MPGLQIHTSNRLEHLLTDLAGIVREPAAGIFVPETVVVQSAGMGRWITLRLAEAQGICANVNFVFPGKFVADLIDAALPLQAEARYYTRENLTWRIMHLLPGLAHRAEFVDLRRYLEQPRPELRLFQLAEKIASSFDQYLAFRPKMILDWEENAETHWQAILWRAVRSTTGGHPPALAREFSRSLGKSVETLPRRVSLFGISSLPAFYLDFFRDLARAIDVHLFVMQPTAHWWGDIHSERDESRARRKVSPAAQLEMQFARGNPLLASYGKLGRQFLETVTDLEPAQEFDNFEAPPPDSVLTQIQRDIFDLYDPLGGTPRPVAPNDDSLQFHSCHSPMREMEVLHDQLLALFAHNPALKPHDIVVMAPDIGVYAPFIGAVFDTAPERLRIPFTIADRGARAENGVIDTFMRILELAGSRFTANSVLSVLESGALRRRFEIADTDLETIRTWIAETGIRWGIDAAQRAALGLPEFVENSWRAGLDRLLLGYAAPARQEGLFEGILAYDNIEGSLAETLGRFVEFSEALFAAAGTLDRPRALLPWQETLRQIAHRFFPPDDEREPELRQLRRVLDSLGETAELSGFSDTVPLDVLLAHLGQALANTESGFRFREGCITFCALKPMRTVPFRVVCLVGMNATAYPRHTRAPGFDLIAQNPRPGDRSTRDDDRYLFLEALLSARATFYVSYVGQSIRDNSALPPSVLVSELLDYARESFDLAERAPLVRRHRLQPFNADYFRPDSGLFSYSQENCAAGVAAAAERATPPVFIQSPLEEPEPELRQLDAETLIRFFGNPAKFFAQQRLDLRTPREENALDDFEPLEIGGLDKYILQQDLLQRALANEDFDQLLPVIRANGELPPGHAGESRLRQMIDAAEKFGDLVRQHLGAGLAEARDVQLELGEFTLQARLDKIYDGRLVQYRQTTCKPKDLLTAWIYHLVANCAAATPSILITADKYGKPVEHNFAPLAPSLARERLQELLGLYWRGLREPLPFYPKSSLAFAEAMLNDKDALLAARKIWEEKHYENDAGVPAESAEPYLALAFRNVAEPFGEDFQETTRAIFQPLLEATRS